MLLRYLVGVKISQYVSLLGNDSAESCMQNEYFCFPSNSNNVVKQTQDYDVWIQRCNRNSFYTFHLKRLI